MRRVNIIETELSFKELTKRNFTEKIVIHHTGSPSDDDLSALEIHHIHLNNGWAGIGYHFVIRKDGAVERGRPVNSVGSHAYGYNYCSIGIHVCGNFESAQPTHDQLEALTGLIADLCEAFSLQADNNVIVTHRDLMDTVCPGINLYNRRDEIISKAKQYLRN